MADATLHGCRVAFTGKLVSMTRASAHALVRERGGEPCEHVTRRVQMLVVGEEGWPLASSGRVSHKLRDAMELRREGVEIEIAPESEFLARLGYEEAQREVHRLYTSAMLARILGVEPAEIRRWERLGLIRPARRVFRLTYYDFQEATGARRLAELLKEGVSPQALAEALRSLAGWLPGVERPLAQLSLLAEGGRLRLRHGAGWVEPTGQRLLAFGESASERVSEWETASSVRRLSEERWLPDTHSLARPLAHSPATAEPATYEGWLALGRDLADAEELDEAADALRNALLLDGPRAEANFELANVLYRQGQAAAAAERFRATLEVDPDYVEAWNNLGCILSELGRLEEAAEAFRCALQVHPDYPEAHYGLAEVLDALDRRDEAARHWKAYLAYDTRSHWADVARRRLEHGPGK